MYRPFTYTWYYITQAVVILKDSVLFAYGCSQEVNHQYWAIPGSHHGCDSYHCCCWHNNISGQRLLQLVEVLCSTASWFCTWLPAFPRVRGMGRVLQARVGTTATKYSQTRSVRAIGPRHGLGHPAAAGADTAAAGPVAVFCCGLMLLLSAAALRCPASGSTACAFHE